MIKSAYFTTTEREMSRVRQALDLFNFDLRDRERDTTSVSDWRRDKNQVCYAFKVREIVIYTIRITKRSKDEYLIACAYWPNNSNLRALFHNPLNEALKAIKGAILSEGGTIAVTSGISNCAINLEEELSLAS